MNNQQQLPPITGEELSEEDKHVIALFSDMRGKQLDFLDEAGKSVIGRIATFLAVLFGVTAFGNTFPPPYLKGNLPAKFLIVATLVFYLLSLFAATRVIQPFSYSYNNMRIDMMKDVLASMNTRKIRWLNRANILFTLGSITLGALIITIIWNV